MVIIYFRDATISFPCAACTRQEAREFPLGYVVWGGVGSACNGYMSSPKLMFLLPGCENGSSLARIVYKSVWASLSHQFIKAGR